MYDIVIKGGRIVDGTGKEAFTGDVAIEGDTIAAVSDKPGALNGKHEVDADGLLVTPGFVDIHTHYDAQVTWDPQMTPSSWHGVTSVVMGSCGVGFAPARPDRHEWLIGLMEGVEDIPGAALSEGIDWDWETFPEYLDALEGKERVLDFAAQVPHGAVRGWVMGDRGAANEPATAEDIEEMSRIVEESLRAGAMGFSTSRTLLHKAIDGVPVPGTFAGKDELFGIGQALKRSGRGIFQLAGEHLDMAAELEWIRELALEIQRPVSFNLSQIDQSPELWRDVLSLLERARADGAPVIAQVAGRAIGVLMSWRGTAHPFVGTVGWANVGWLPWEEHKAKLKDPEVRAKIVAENPADLGEFANFVTTTFEKMYPIKAGYEPDPSESVAAIAAREGRSPREVAYDLLMENDGEGMLYFPLFNYADGDLSLLHRLHQHEGTRMGLSDAGAHCGAICDGGMPTFMLTHWTRDRSRGPKLGLEHIVKRQTSQTAELFGLLDRGVLAPGYRADVNVIDYENLSFDRPKLVWDLPAGGRRLTQRAHGYKMTMCRGEVTVQDGEPTGALPGRLLRGPQAGPAR